MLQPPTGLVVAYTSNRAGIEARWVNPTGAPFERVRLLRRLDAAPTGPSDAMATLVYEGPNALAPDVLDQLVPDMPYRGYPFGGGAKPALASRQAMRQPRIYTYAVYACSASACETTGATTTFRRNLTEALQKGGYTIFWRHASASTCSDDFGLGLASSPLIPDWWKTCRSVAIPTTCGVRATDSDGGVVITTPGPFGRQLTDPAATTEITNVRTYLQTQTIPLSQALASEFCRCSETARGFFSHLSATVPVQERPELTLSVYGGRCPNINSLTTTPPAAATNVGLVSHSGMGCSTDALVWSQAAVFKPTLTGALCASPTVCPGADDVCVSGACWRRELIGTICDDEWAEIPPL